MSSLKVINICIDPGHGGVQSGAVSKTFGYLEKDIALDISLKVRDYLLYATKEGDSYIINDFCKDTPSLVEVSMTRTTDMDISLANRCSFANSKGSRLFVSIHCNSCASEEPNGIETWCYDSKKSKSKTLAMNIQNSIMDRVKDFRLDINNEDHPIKSRGVKATTAYYTLRHTTMPSVVVECGFMSNPQEVYLLYNSEKYRIAIAKGIAEGILKSL